MAGKNVIQSLVTLEWINRKLKENRLKLADVCSYTGISQPYISKIFSGKINMSKSMKVMFFLYFKTKLYERKPIRDKQNQNFYG